MKEEMEEREEMDNNQKIMIKQETEEGLTWSELSGIICFLCFTLNSFVYRYSKADGAVV